MKDRFFDDAAVPQMLNDDALEKRGRHPRVPNSIRIYHNDRPSFTDAEARRFPAFHAAWTEEQSLSLQQARKEAIQIPAPPVGRAEPASAHEDVS